MDPLGELTCRSKGCGGLLYIGNPSKSLNSMRDVIRCILQVGHPAKLSAVSTTTHDLTYIVLKEQV